MGCHQLIPGQKTSLMSMVRYKDAQEQLPPKLLTEGARVDPEWLLRFLKNPSLSDKDHNRNGVRSYLEVRMPTFSFSENELGKLVPLLPSARAPAIPLIPEEVPVLTTKETEMARSLFSSTAAPCLKCHATGDPAHDRFATAPNFLQARGRLKPIGWSAGSSIPKPSARARPCLPVSSSARAATGFSPARLRLRSRVMIKIRQSFWWTTSSSSHRKSSAGSALPWVYPVPHPAAHRPVQNPPANAGRGAPE